MLLHHLRLPAIVLSLSALSAEAGAQKRCTKGIPCGGTCISADKVCRVGSPSSTPSSKPGSRPSAPATRPSTPAVSTASEPAPARVEELAQPLATRPPPFTFLLLGGEGTQHIVGVRAHEQTDRMFYAAVVDSLCSDLSRDCTVLFWPATSAYTPTSMPISRRSRNAMIAQFSQSGERGSRAFYFMRDGKRID
jgi:hypothetical protein